MSKQERSYRTIRQRILDGTYGPGYRLTIDTLARELGMSQVPIREGIRRLEAEGWVMYRPNVGPQVAPVDREKWADAMETLALLEGYATALAAPQLEPKEIRRLWKLNASMEEAIEALDVLTFSKLNREFHTLIYAKSSNDYLVDRINETFARLDAIRVTVFMYIPQRSRLAIKEHENIIQAIEQQASASKIERLSREHKLRTMKAYIEYGEKNKAAG